MKKLLFSLLLLAATLPNWAEDLYLVGNAVSIGWNINNAMRATKMTETGSSTNVYEWTGYFKASGQFKILTNKDSWDYGYNATSSIVTLSEPSSIQDRSGGDNQWKVASDGIYKITVNTSEKTIKAESATMTIPTLTDGYYQIGTANDLKNFADAINKGAIAPSVKAKLTANIDMNSITDFTPICCANAIKFTGEFDGQGYAITNLKVDYNTSFGYTGLFCYATDGAVIKNLIVGTGCSFKGTEKIGGIIGSAEGGGTVTLTNVINMANVTSTGNSSANAAGLVGCGQGGTIIEATNCANTGEIHGQDGECAAFAGWTQSGTSFTNCWNIGDIYNMDNNQSLYRKPGNAAITLSNCYDANGADFYTQGTKIARTTVASGELCYKLNGSTSGGTNWTQTIGTDTYPIPFNTSMLVFKNGSEYDNIEKDGDWYKISNANELKLFSSKVNAGSPALNAKLTNDIDMTSVNDYTPIGASDNSKKYKGTFDGQNHYINLNIDNTSGSRLGLIGYATAGAYVKNLIIKGSINGEKYIGGFVGSLSRTDQDGTLTFENCGNEANITATDINAGGLLGCSFDGGVQVVMKNCYNSGTIKGNQSGQLTAWSTNTQIENCYTIGDSDNCDPFARLGGGSNTITNCYCDKDLTWNGHPTQVTSEQIASGELCYLLKGTQETNAFTQAIGTDPYPTFGSATVDRGQWFGDDYIYYNIDESGNITVNELNLDDTKTVYNVPAKVTAKSVTLTRTLHKLTADGNQPRWNTFCSPVAIDKSNFSAAKELTGVTVNGDNYSMTFADVTGDVLEAGKPYMVQVSEGKSSLTASNVAVATDVTPVTFNGLTFKGNFINGNAPLGSFIISNNVFYNVDSNVTLKAFRGYIEVASGNNVKALDFTFDDDATGIKTLSDSPLKGENIYNLAGQRLLKAQKGINIVNGKKILK